MTVSTSPISRATQSPKRSTLRHRPRGRTATIFVMIGSLIAAGLLRDWAASRQDSINHMRYADAPKSTLGNMDSFALALMLGGLRGPLVMWLWPAIENQKADRNLDDVDTMIEWVRLLQPEFDSVHIFQIWNKAYNLSAMKASFANKYTDVIDALEYGASVDKERPGDINILSAIQDVYGQKLGNVNLPEYNFYCQQFREDSMTRANRDRVYPADKDMPRLARSKTVNGLFQKPLLTEDARIRPDLLQPTRQRPADRSADAEWNDGSELQYLKQFEPFPYGMSQMAMSYNYSKRAEVALSAEGQRPLQTVAMVIDSHPAISLKIWEEDEIHYAQSAEEHALPYSDAINLARVMAALKSGTLHVDRDAITAAIYYYENCVKISREAIKEYRRHLAKPEYALRIETYRQHLEEMETAVESNIADRDCLQALLLAESASDADLYRRSILEHAQAVLLDSAAAHYDQAILNSQRIVLRYYMEDMALWPQREPFIPTMPGAHLKDRPSKAAVLKLTDAEVNGLPGAPGVFDKAMSNTRLLRIDERDHDTERANYQARINRYRGRISSLRPSGVPIMRPANPFGPLPPLEFK